MATFYRTSFDQQPESNVDARRSLAIVTALEYQRGLELNPYHGQVRGFFGEFLAQNPWLEDEPGIYQRPERLVREGLAIAPCFVVNHLKLVDFLEAEGRFDEAYRVMAEDALPWAMMRYDDYGTYQQALFVRLLRAAKSRDDQAILKKLLETMG